MAILDKIFDCPAGRFSGCSDEKAIYVKGIRYATAERFGRPLPYKYPKDVVQKCDTPSPFGVQLQPQIETYLFGVEYDKLPQVEDPLYMSLTLPPDAGQGDPLPVMVWIHGGAYKNGGCDAPYYDTSLLSSEGDVIVVGINYRLSIFGFVKDRDGEPANNGLYDVIEGLKWVRENISAFGGDPDNVTIFGQSAGADIVRCIMLSRDTETLYRRAIIQSDPFGSTIGRERMEGEILDRLNKVALDASTEEYRHCLADICANVTEKNNAKYMIFAPHYGLAPMVPPEEYPRRLGEIAFTHELLIGSAAREVSVYVARNKIVRRLYALRLTRPLIERILLSKSSELFGEPTVQFAREYAECGGKAYHYNFVWGENHSFLTACHTLEFLPLFGGKCVEGRESAMGLTADEIEQKGAPLRKIWTDFARSGEIETTGIEGMITVSEL